MDKIMRAFLFDVPLCFFFLWQPPPIASHYNNPPPFYFGGVGVPPMPYGVSNRYGSPLLPSGVHYDYGAPPGAHGPYGPITTFPPRGFGGTLSHSLILYLLYVICNALLKN